MIAIQTKYLPATTTLGSRIKAWANKGQSVTIPYPHELSNERVYFAAVEALIEKYDLAWSIDDMRYGSTENGYVFCFANSVVKDL